jgi:transposase-like protein
LNSVVGHIDELANARGVKVDHVTVQRRVGEYSPELTERARRVMKSSADSSRMDET